MSASSLTNITTATGVAFLNVEGDNSALVHLRGGSVAATGIAVTFEASADSTTGTDGTWFSILGARVNANTAETSLTNLSLAVNAGGTTAYRFNVAEFKFLRVRGTARTAGNYNVLIRSDIASFESVPTISPVANPSPTGVAVLDPSTASTNIASLRTAATDIYELTVSNPTATPAYVKLYDKATAPVLATDVPVLTIPVGPSPLQPIQALSFGFLGKRFSAGLGVAITGGPAATDATNSPAGVIVHLTRGA